MFTGYSVVEHDISSRNHQLNTGHSIWEQLRDEFNYCTAVFSNNPFITRPKYGLQKGFDEIISDLPTRVYPVDNAGNPETFNQELADDSDSKVDYLKYCIKHEKPISTFINGLCSLIDSDTVDNLPIQLSAERRNTGKLYADKFLRWEDTIQNQWAACINLVDAHHPYTPRSEYNLWGGGKIKSIQSSLQDHRWDFHTGKKPWWQRKALESLYDGCILEADNAVKQIIQQLRSRNSLENTLIVITSDHGEGFGEFSRVRPNHRITGNESGIHECQVHVPLIVKRPRQQSGTVINKLATLSRFQEVVQGEVITNKSKKGFAPGRPIVSSANYDAKYEAHVRAFDEYIKQMDSSAFSGWAHAVYDDTEGRVMKYSKWDEFESSVQVLDAQNSMKMSNEADDMIKEYIQPLDNAAIRTEISNKASNQTRQRLQDLGYL